jgi:hypothetical protein
MFLSLCFSVYIHRKVHSVLPDKSMFQWMCFPIKSITFESYSSKLRLITFNFVSHLLMKDYDFEVQYFQKLLCFRVNKAVDNRNNTSFKY